MGQTLSEPVTNKETAICQDENYKVSSRDDSCGQKRKKLHRVQLRCINITLQMSAGEEKTRFTPDLFANHRSLLVPRSAAAACRDGERRWKTRTLTSSRFRTIRPLRGSVFTVSAPLEMSKSVKIFNLQLFLDGHGGSIVAKYASKHLHKFIIQRPEFPNDIPEALKQVSEIIKRLYS